jgi:hypothetical protein
LADVVTPALSAVYEELLLRACQPPFDQRASAWRAEFEHRTGSFPADHPNRSARDGAGWEDALVLGGLADAVGASLEDAAEQALSQVIARAQRGLFELASHNKHPFLRDLWDGGAFLLLARDEVGRAAGDTGGTVFLGRVVAGVDGCAVLPGLVWLPSESVPLLGPLVEGGKARGMELDDFAEALLRMDHALATMSRVKAQFAFRLEHLDGAAGAPHSRR